VISTRLIGIGYNNLLLLQTCANIKTYNCIKSYISTTHRTSKTVQRRLDAPEFLMLQACYATATSSLKRDWSTELSSLADAARRADVVVCDIDLNAAGASTQLLASVMVD